ncbi:MAG TPA: N-acetylglucosamine-6-phosphate deacetylase, partial [Spirochaetia bacterium]|nr:N-acetylglucosamine-6-phosphate deacetylase [Spirochaetia bacterium]
MTTLVGRIPGRPGLWEVSVDGDRVQEVTCRQRATNDARGPWITPGLFDLQINGIGGINFTDPSLTPADVARADELIRASGVSRYCATVITCGQDTARTVLSTLAAARAHRGAPGLWAVHLEGPWISEVDGARGVHRREHVRAVSLAEWDALQEAAGGMIRILTLAPELPGAIELVARASRAGTVVSIGHTMATPAVIAAAVAAGASMSTHLLNGCPQLLDRHSNVVYSQLSQDELFASFIADGHHVPFPALRVALRAKGIARSVLVSDMAPLAGMPDGDYEMEGRPVELRDGGLRVKGSSLLSGAARTLAQDVQWLAGQPEPGIEAALLM